MSNSEISVFVKRHPLGTTCVVLALVFAVGSYLVNGRLADATALLEQKTSEGARLATNLKNGAQLADQVTALSAAVAKIESRLIQPTQLATNLQYFYRLENESGVELIDLRQTSTSAQPAKPAATKSTTGVGFAISVKGEYDVLLGCLQRLENGFHISRLLSASLSTGSVDRSGPLTLSLSLELLGQP